MFHSCAHHHPPIGLAIGGLLAMWLATAGSARAETITVPLPELLGQYSAADVVERSTSVMLGVDPNEIVSVSMHVAGSVHVGITECLTEGDIGWKQYPLRANLRLRANDPVEDGYLAASAPVPNLDVAEMDAVFPFERSAQFRAYSGATWDFVTNGPVELQMSGLPTTSGFSDCNWLLVPQTTLEVAELVVETLGRVPGAESAWGAVKALYR